MCKTYSVTGWRVGWVLAPPDLTDSIRKVHDFLTVGAAAPLQQAGVYCARAATSYYRSSADGVHGAPGSHRRDRFKTPDCDVLFPAARIT